jgi:hypothetical protein
MTLPPLRDTRELVDCVRLLRQASPAVRATADFAAIRDHVVAWADRTGNREWIPADLRADAPPPPRDAASGRFTPKSTMTPERRQELLDAHLALLGPLPPPTQPLSTHPTRTVTPPGGRTHFTVDGVRLPSSGMSEERRRELLRLSGFPEAH